MNAKINKLNITLGGGEMFNEGGGGSEAAGRDG